MTDTILDYIISLDRELEKRYPSAVENIDGIGGKNTIQLYINACHF